MADKQFSIDDILSEYPQKKESVSPAKHDNFSLEDVLNSDSSAMEDSINEPKFIPPLENSIPKMPAFMENFKESPLLTTDENLSEEPIFEEYPTYGDSNNGGNIVIGKKKNPDKPDFHSEDVFETIETVHKVTRQQEVIARKERDKNRAIKAEIYTERELQKNDAKTKKAALKRKKQLERERHRMEQTYTDELPSIPDLPKMDNDYKFPRYVPDKNVEDEARYNSYMEETSSIDIPHEEIYKEKIPSEYNDITEFRSKKSKNRLAENTARLSFENKDIKPIKRKITGNTEIIDNLMRIKRERVSKTALINPVERKNISDIDLKLDDKILPNTEQIFIDPNVNEMEKFNDLKERRKKKIRDFVLVGDEEEDSPDEMEEASEYRSISDFESFEDAPSVLNDILQLKSSLIIRLIFLIITGLASIYTVVANDFGFPIIEILNRETQPTTYLFVTTIFGLIAAFVSYTVISCGLSKLFTLKADCDSISAIAITASLLSAMISLANPSLVSRGICNVFVPVAIVSLIFNTIGKLLIVGRTASNFQYISGDFERYAVFTVENEEKASQFTRGTLTDFPVLASMRKTEFISDFLKNSYAPDITDKFCKIAGPAIFIAGIVFAIISTLLYESVVSADRIYVALSSFAGTVSLCSCFAIMLVVNMPLNRACKKQLEYSSTILSYESVEQFADTNSVLVDVSQLFPQGMINLAAIKIFSDTRIDEAIVEAASLTNHAGSILKHMFYDIIAGKTELLNPVESYIYEDSMGLCGWINNKRVLLGNRELMTNHSIEGMPTKAREKEYTENGKSAVYLSISGELSAMFIIEIKASIEVQKWLRQLEKNEVYVMLRTVDSIISINKLSELFSISPEMLKLLPFRLHPNYEEETSYVPRQSASMACSGRFQSFVSLIVGAKRIRKTATIGMSIQAASVILGLILALVMAILSSFSELSASIVLMYNCVWAAITIILQGFRKT